MITIITGAPGSGKTSAVVDLLKIISKDRPLFVSGIPEFLIEHTNLEDPTKWPEVVPDGALVIIDEVQRIWRPRGPGSKVPIDISMLETHRHRGLDFYVITQSPKLIDSNVRGLCGRHIHLRDLGILGRFWYEWPECNDNCAASWKNAPIKKRYRLPKSVFALYKSASIHIKPIRSFPWMLSVLFIALLLLVFLSWKAYTSIQARININPPPISTTMSMQSKDIGYTINKKFNLINSENLIYDTSAFIPRISNRPESAPLFDKLRVVVNMPLVVGGFLYWN